MLGGSCNYKLVVLLINLQVKEMVLGTVRINHLLNFLTLSGEILGLMLDITILFTMFIQKLGVSVCISSS